VLALAPLALVSHAAPSYHRFSSTASAASQAQNAPGEDLRSLGLEVARMGREALARAKALEAELRKLAGSGAGPGSLDAEPWFQSCARTVAALPSLGEAGLSAELAVLLVGATASPTDFSSSAAAPDSHTARFGVVRSRIKQRLDRPALVTLHENAVIGEMRIDTQHQRFSKSQRASQETRRRNSSSGEQACCASSHGRHGFLPG